MNKLLVVFVFAILSGCLDNPLGNKSNKASLVAKKSFQTKTVSVDNTSNESGVVSASIDANSNAPQQLNASGDSGVSGSSVLFPPGTLSVSSLITLEEGVGLASNDTSAELGISGLEPASKALVLSSSASVDPVAPFTISLTIEGSSLNLADEVSKFAIVYKVVKYSEGGTNFVGVIGPDLVKIDGNKISFSASFFGSYQVIYSTPEVKTVEVPSQTTVVTKRQKVAKKEEAAATAIVTTTKEPALVIPDDPKKLTATFIEPDTIVLKWQPVDKAIGYVLRQASGSTIEKKCRVGNFLNIKSSSVDMNYTDVSPGTYTFRLCTLGSGNAESEGAVATVTVPEPPAVVTDPKPTPSSTPEVSTNNDPTPSVVVTVSSVFDVIADTKGPRSEIVVEPQWIDHR